VSGLIFGVSQFLPVYNRTFIGYIRTLKREAVVRTIQVSTDVFAAIWADRKGVEESEDAILRRRLGVKSPPPKPKEASVASGFTDEKQGFICKEGFEIFRTYKGIDYRVRALGGFLVLQNTGARYRSPKELSDATVGHENAWTGWYCRHPTTGKKVQIGELRDQSRIRRRGPSLDEL